MYIAIYTKYAVCMFQCVGLLNGACVYVAITKVTLAKNRHQSIHNYLHAAGVAVAVPSDTGKCVSAGI